MYKYKLSIIVTWAEVGNKLIPRSLYFTQNRSKNISTMKIRFFHTKRTSFLKWRYVLRVLWIGQLTLFYESHIFSWLRNFWILETLVSIVIFVIFIITVLYLFSIFLIYQIFLLSHNIVMLFEKKSEMKWEFKTMLGQTTEFILSPYTI